MKNLFKLLILVFVCSNTFSAMAQDLPLDHNYFQISPRVGFDFPKYDNNTPHIDYKGGVDLGISVDYYWTWFGLGADFDFIKNKPESVYQTSNLHESSLKNPINSFNLNEEDISRMFYGIGPNAQYRTNNGKFTAELNTRFGLASIKGGRTSLEGTSITPTTSLLNFHAGYNASSVFTFKGQLRFTYFLNKNIGVNLGAYYMQHFGASELNESGVSASYQPLTTDTFESITVFDGNQQIREQPCDCDISSIGVFAGVTYKFSKSTVAVDNTCPVCGDDHFPHCCATCGCDVTITAKDKFSAEILPNTEIILEDLYGNVVQSGTTDAQGIIVFYDVAENDYIISGKLYDISLEQEIISKDMFKKCRRDLVGIEKVLVYSDENFILKGNVEECEVVEAIQGVDITLTDTINGIESNTLSDADGNFIFIMKPVTPYTLSGEKDGYYSNKVEFTTSLYNRDSVLFLDFEMCIDPCGKVINLDNINFDLNKANILPASMPDLDHIVELMKENKNIQVEMTSHTDSQGSDAYNKQLSQRRAEATVNYIVSQGISKKRLIARGAGETELKNTKCSNNVPCTDEEHRVNRRTEFKVLCF